MHWFFWYNLLLIINEIRLFSHASKLCKREKVSLPYIWKRRNNKQITQSPLHCVSPWMSVVWRYRTFTPIQSYRQKIILDTEILKILHISCEDARAKISGFDEINIWVTRQHQYSSLLFNYWESLVHFDEPINKLDLEPIGTWSSFNVGAFEI